MAILDKQLLRHTQSRDLVSIRRSEIDDHSIQAFILDYSDSLLLLQYVYDFNLDGYMILRRSDITELRQSKTDAFQKKLLITEGLFEKVDFSFRISLSSYNALLVSLLSDEIVIVETELSNPADFFIGRILEANDTEAKIQYFTGIGRVLRPASSIPIADITSCQLSSNYINVYKRHFQRKAKKKKRTSSSSQRAKARD